MEIQYYPGYSKVKYDATKTRKPEAKGDKSIKDFVTSFQYRDLLNVNLMAYKVNSNTVSWEVVSSLFYAGCTMEQAIKFVLNMAVEVK